MAQPDVTSSWHVPPTRIVAYLDDRLDEPSAASIEAHLLACATCRAELATSAAAVPHPDARADAHADTWAAIERRIDAASAAPIERLVGRLGLSPGTARLLAPTPALRWSWSLAMVAALVSAAWLSRMPVGMSVDLARVGFFTIAPLAPLVAVVTALSASAEPSAEIAGATSLSRLRIGALRAATVLAASIGLGLAASLILQGSWGRAVVWLCPALALSGVGALVASRWSPAVTISVIGSAWVALVVVAARVLDDRLAAFRPTPQIMYLVAAAGAVALVAARPSTFELRSTP